jgi:cysteine desulfurase/selenocysteine lyase
VPVDFRAWGCDFAAFSGHKCFGPTGVGALFHRENASAGVELKPVFLGGGIITKASLHDFELVANRERFEAGTPNIAGWLGLGAAFEFISKHASFMQEQERSLVKAMLPLAEKRGVHYYGSRDAARKIGIFSFNVGRLKHHEVAVMFDSLARVCVRSGHHCAMPLHRELFGVDGSVRASVHAYNTLEEVAAFQGTLDKITRLA